MTKPLIRTKDLSVEFSIGGKIFNKKTLKAVNDVSFEIPRGAFVGVVGESGSAMMSRTVIRGLSAA